MHTGVPFGLRLTRKFDLASSCLLQTQYGSLVGCWSAQCCTHRRQFPFVICGRGMLMYVPATCKQRGQHSRATVAVKLREFLCVYPMRSATSEGGDAPLPSGSHGRRGGRDRCHAEQAQGGGLAEAARAVASFLLRRCLCTLRLV